MKNHRSPSLLTHRLIFGSIAAALTAAFVVTPASAQETEAPDCESPSSGLQERGEMAALELAAACDAEVLIRGSQNYTGRSFAQPDGSIESEFSATPRWVEDAAGEWIEADAAVAVSEDGVIETSATVSDLQFGGAGETAFVTAMNDDGEAVALTWPEPLPEPQIEAETVTYPEVLPDVDLQVQAGVADFSYALVVKSPEAAADPSLDRVELGLETQGLAVAADASSDTAELTDDSGEVAFEVASPWMWDSSDNGDGIPSRAAAMDLEMDADSLAVIPDQELLGDPDAEYPIYIDPKFRDTSVAWTNFLYGESRADQIQCGNGSVMCSGLQAWENDPALGYWRAGMIFNGLGSLASRDVLDAGVWIKQTHTGGTGTSYKVNLVAMDYFNPSTATFDNTFDEQVVGNVASDTVPTSNDNYGESDQTIHWDSDSLEQRIRSLVQNGSNTAPFVVVSANESDKKQWRKMDPSSAVLVVSHRAGAPVNLKIEGKNCSTSAPGSVLNSTTPVMRATTPERLTANARLDFRVVKPMSGPDDVVAEKHLSDVSQGTAYSTAIPSGSLTRGETYYWVARVRDYDSSSALDGVWSSRCYFRVNSAPGTPTGLSTEGLGCGTSSSPTLVTTAHPKLSAVPNDPDGGTVSARYRFYEETGDNIREWSVQGFDGVAAPTRVAAGLVTSDGLYRWRVITDDAFTSSAWSGYCWLRVDTTAPEPPDVIQVTTDPLPGEPVQFEFIGGDDVTGFEYVLEGQTRKSVSAADGQTKVSVTPTTSSVDHALQVWSVDAAGNTSSPTTYWFTTIESQPAEAVGAWRFDGDLLDDAGGHDLYAIDTAGFGADRAGRADAAATLDGTGGTCLAAGDPVLNTADSFTVAGWVHADAAPESEAAVLDVTGEVSSNLKLFLSAGGRWGVTMLSSDDADRQATSVLADASVTEFGTWTHVAGVYDAAAERLRLYVNGSLEASQALRFEPWAATNTFSVGCGVKGDGSTFGHFAGAVDDALAFQQVLTADQITELMDGQGMPSALQAWYPLRGDGADHSGRGADLTALPTDPVWLPDQYGRADSALELDGQTCPTADAVPVRTDSAFTVSAWARLDADHVDAHPQVFNFHGSQAFAVMAKYNASTDHWVVAVTDADTQDPDWGDGAVSAEVASEEEWTQITVTIDPDDDRLQLFVDGELSDTGSISSIWDPWRAEEFTIGCGGQSDGTRFHQWDGAISDVRIWRGALEADEVAAAHVEQLSMWRLDQDVEGSDEWGANDLVFNEAPSWEVDRWNECWAAYGLALNGSSWAETPGPVITTDDSFTVAAWVRIDDVDDYRTIVSQTGGDFGAFNLNYSPLDGGFQFSMPQNSDGTGTWTRVVAQAPPVIDEETGLGRWYHLVGQVDLGTGAIRLYIDGELQGEAPVVDSPWHADGALTIGAAEQRGAMTNQMVGAIDQAQTWAGVLDPLSIEALAADRPSFEKDPDRPGCEDSEEPPVDL